MIQRQRISVWDRKKQCLVSIEVLVEIDVIGIAKMLGDKANRNRSKVSKALHGMVEVKVETGR